MQFKIRYHHPDMSFRQRLVFILYQVEYSFQVHLYRSHQFQPVFIQMLKIIQEHILHKVVYLWVHVAHQQMDHILVLVPKAFLVLISFHRLSRLLEIWFMVVGFVELINIENRRVNSNQKNVSFSWCWF